jgi:RNA polymerase sigma-70 factor (ECF subfamily)
MSSSAVVFSSHFFPGALPASAPDLESDGQLMRQVQDGSQSALDTLYRRNAAKAVNVAYSILGDRDLSEEVVQEAFWRVWQRASQFQIERGQFVNWLVGIVRHLALDELDRRKNFSLFEYDPDMDSEPPPADQVTENFADGVLDRVQTEHIWAAVTTLPQPQRQVIELSYVHGLTREQIARKLGEPLGTIHTRAALGLRKLRTLIGVDAWREA